MRAQCCICADLFENSASINIAAVPCGHTFHEECLMRWLATSSTCPSCRKQVKKNQIIKRLYFDIAEEEAEGTDSNKLLNEINNLKAQICGHAVTKKELEESRDALRTCLASKEEVCTQLRKEQQDKILLNRELASVGKEIIVYKRELADFAATQKRLKRMESIQLMLEGSEQDVCDMVRCYSDGGETAVKQLSSMVVVVKREYNKALEDKKDIRDQIRVIKTEAAQTQTKMNRMRQEIKKMQLLLKKSNQDVFALEQENNVNRRKIVHLRSAIKQNKTVGSQSFMAAVHDESPNVAYTPPSSHVDAEDKSGDDNPNSTSNRNCMSPDLFDESISDEPDRNSENGTQVYIAPSVLKMVHISTAAEKFQAAKQAKIESDNKAAPSLPYSNFSIMQKKLTGLSNSRPLALPKSRTYNGFGGSTKVEEPFLTPNRGRVPLKRKVPQKRYPLAPKPLPNQPKLLECLPKKSSFCATSSDEHHESIRFEKPPSTLIKKKQPFLTHDLFKKSVKGSSTTATSSSSSVSSHLSRPSSGFIDLT